ncbi:MAG: radical SAM protein [Candidatus Methanoperedens sp.]|nr:radical SAM protein [Candidatus Methanoperedens sp.]
MTKRCNLSCVHCSAQSNAKGKEMSFTEIKIILDKAVSLGLENVGFTGGEPLIRRDKLMRLLAYCKQVLDLKTHIHTNGTLLTSKDASFLAELADETSITILGALAQTHDEITSVKGSLKATEKGLKTLLNKHGNVRTYLVPMKSNYKETSQIIGKAFQMGCIKFRLLLLSPTGRARESFDDITLDPTERRWLSTELMKIGERLDIDIDVGFCTRQDYPQLGELYDHQYCLAAENRMHIGAFGEVFPCTASSGLQTFSGGNIKTHDLADLWKASPVLQFFRYFHSNPPLKCRTCIEYGQCMGGCRVMMFHRYRDFTIAKSDCRSQKSLSLQTF